MEYLHIGTNKLESELFNPVLSHVYQSYKPCGGIWTTDYEEGLIQFNNWLTFLERKRMQDDGIYEKKISNNGVIIKLKDNAKLLKPESTKEAIDILESYRYDGFLDYQQISKDYDGMSINSPIIWNSNFNDWSIPSTVLFNYQCIDSYRPIDIGYEEIGYRIAFWENYIGNPQIIQGNNYYNEEEFNELYNLYIDFIDKAEITNYETYNDYYKQLHKLSRDFINKYIDIIQSMNHSQNKDKTMWAFECSTFQKLIVRKLNK